MRPGIVFNTKCSLWQSLHSRSRDHATSEWIPDRSDNAILLLGTVSVYHPVEVQKHLVMRSVSTTHVHNRLAHLAQSAGPGGSHRQRNGSMKPRLCLQRSSSQNGHDSVTKSNVCLIRKFALFHPSRPNFVILRICEQNIWTKEKSTSIPSSICSMQFHVFEKRGKFQYSAVQRVYNLEAWIGTIDVFLCNICYVLVQGSGYGKVTYISKCRR